MRAVTQQRYRTGRFQPLARRIGVRSPEIAVSLDSHVHRFIDSGQPRPALVIGSTKHRPARNIGLADQPLQRLKTTQRTPDHSVDLPDAEMIGKELVCLDHIAHSKQREIIVERLTGWWQRCGRSGAAVATTQHIGANYEIYGRIEKFTLLHGVRPPIGHLRISGKRMHDPDTVRAVSIQCAVSVISHGNTRERLSRLQLKSMRIMKKLNVAR